MGYFLSAMHRRLDEERHEAELHAVLLLEAVLVAVAQLHHRRHVEFVEGGEDGRCLLRLNQAFGDAGAQAGHRYALLGAVAGQGGFDRRGNRGGGRGRLDALIQGGEHVALGDAPIAAAAGDLGGIDGVFRGDLACRRARCRGGGLARSGGRSLGRLGRRGGGRLGLAVYHGDDFAAGDHAAVALDDLGEHAVLRGGQFEHHLVGFDVDQVFAALDRFADLLVPGEQGGFGYGFGQCRDFDFDLHVASLLVESGEW